MFVNHCQLHKLIQYCTLLQKEANQGVKETIQDSVIQTDGPAQSLPNVLTEKLELKTAELEASLLRERELQQQLEEANKKVDREREETRNEIKDVQEKVAEVKGLKLFLY